MLLVFEIGIEFFFIYGVLMLSYVIVCHRCVISFICSVVSCNSAIVGNLLWVSLYRKKELLFMFFLGILVFKY